MRSEFQFNETFDHVRELITGKVWSGPDGPSECAAALWALLDRCIKAEEAGSTAAGSYMQLVGVASGELPRAPWPDGFREQFRDAFAKIVEAQQKAWRQPPQLTPDAGQAALRSAARLAKLEYLQRILARGPGVAPVS